MFLHVLILTSPSIPDNVSFNFFGGCSCCPFLDLTDVFDLVGGFTVSLASLTDKLDFLTDNSWAGTLLLLVLFSFESFANA